MNKETSNKSIRIKLTRREKQSLIDKWAESGKSKKDYCQEEGLNYSTFMTWLNPNKGRMRVKFRSQGSIESNQKPQQREEINSGFIPVNIQQNSKSVFARINYDNGNSISIYENVGVDYLKNLLV